MTSVEVAYALYHSLVAAGHAPWCPALDRADGPCRCGRDSALAAYEAKRVRPGQLAGGPLVRGLPQTGHCKPGAGASPPVGTRRSSPAASASSTAVVCVDRSLRARASIRSHNSSSSRR